MQPDFKSDTVKADPNAAQSVYVANVTFNTPGQLPRSRRGAARRPAGGRHPAGPAVRVQAHDPMPAVGEKPPPIDTPTTASVGGDVTKIDTRTPPDDMHKYNLTDVLGKKPVVLVFATPLLCESRVCGPVVDIAEQVEHTMPAAKQFAFIHMEIYNNNKVIDGYRPQVAAFRLPTEPWVFVINKQGRIAARMEGAYSVNELQAAIRAGLKPVKAVKQ